MSARRRWSSIDTIVLAAQYPHMRTDTIAVMLGWSVAAVYSKAGSLGLHKTAEYLASDDACRLRRGDHLPANKGLRRPGWHSGRMAESWFKKGHPGTRTKPIGATRLIDGYLYVKVSAIPCVPWMVNWLPLHILLWERVNGRPLPAGHCLRFRDGDRTNLALENLELITRAENLRRTSVHRLPRALRQVIQLKGALTRQINRRSRHAEHDR